LDLRAPGGLFSDGKTEKWVFAKQDQFVSELAQFADCVLQGRDPRASGEEGLADVRILEALLLSAETGKLVELDPRQRIT